MKPFWTLLFLGLAAASPMRRLGNAGQSTAPLGDLALYGATTDSGRAIEAMLQRTASARVDNAETYTAPAGGPHSLSCRQDTCCIWSHIAEEMLRAFRSRRGQCTALARGAIRLAFHDAAAWNTSLALPADACDSGVGVGGADGSILLSAGEMDRRENQGLADIAHLTRSWYRIYHATHGVSAADLVQMGALVATTACTGGPRIRAFVGRRDVPEGTPPPPPGLLPSPHGDAARAVALFAAKTLTAADLVALVGAHSVSRQHYAETRYAGQSQDSTPAVFDTRFFAETAAAQPPHGVYRFQSDMSLARDPLTRDLWAAYAGADAEAHAAWTEVSGGGRDGGGVDETTDRQAYVAAFFRLGLLGVENLNGLTDCSGVLPASREK